MRYSTKRFSICSKDKIIKVYAEDVTYNELYSTCVKLWSAFTAFSAVPFPLYLVDKFQPTYSMVTALKDGAINLIPE